MTDFKSIPNVLSYVTVRLDCILADGTSSVGTGFCFQFNDLNDPIIITNRHVVDGAVSAKLQLTSTEGEHNTPHLGNHFTALYHNFNTLWHAHPDPTVDLAAIPISNLKNSLTNNDESNSSVYLPHISDSFIPSSDRFQAMCVIEDVVMVGYPIGLWDSHNNLPIFRSGTTATNPGLDYNGRKEFVIDVACFPGSSGSPVFRYVPEFPIESGSGIVISGGGAHIELLGVLYAGPQFNAQGTIEIVTVPTQSVSIANTFITTNLGYVIRSEQLHAFRKICDGT